MRIKVFLLLLICSISIFLFIFKPSPHPSYPRGKGSSLSRSFLPSYRQKRILVLLKREAGIFFPRDAPKKKGPLFLFPDLLFSSVKKRRKGKRSAKKRQFFRTAAMPRFYGTKSNSTSPIETVSPSRQPISFNFLITPRRRRTF